MKLWACGHLFKFLLLHPISLSGYITAVSQITNKNRREADKYNLLNVMWLQKYVNYRSMWNYTAYTIFSHSRQCFGGLCVSRLSQKCTFIFHSCRQGVISTFLICQIRNQTIEKMLGIMKCMHMCMDMRR